MSMRNYAVRLYGVVARLSELNLEVIAAENPECEGDIETVKEWLATEELDLVTSGNIIGHMSSELEGDFINLLEGNTFDDISVELDNDWVILELPRYPMLFDIAYESREDLLQTVKKLYAYILPEDFKWEERLVRLDGVLFG